MAVVSRARSNPFAIPRAPPWRCAPERDSQTVLAALVDAGVADSGRIAATGGSYGGGQSRLLATSLPWTTPKGTPLQLAAAVPLAGWSDLTNVLFPNGRATDDVDQSASHETPFGVYKESYVDVLYAGAIPLGEGRYNHIDPSDLGSALTVDFVAWHLGEPYEQGTLIPPMLAAFRHKSAYYADDYFEGIRSGVIREVPVFAVQGWNDAIIPPVELLQMYRKLKAADPHYPITMAIGDVGHTNTQDVPAQWRAIHGEADAFLDHVFAGEGPGSDRVLSFLTDCFGRLKDPKSLRRGGAPDYRPARTGTVGCTALPAITSATWQSPSSRPNASTRRASPTFGSRRERWRGSATIRASSPSTTSERTRVCRTS